MKFLKYAVAAAALCALPVSACDLCAVYAASEARGEMGRGWFAGVADQFTHFGTLQEDGRKVSNEFNEHLQSSITQVLLGYNFTEKFGVQFNAPFIHRSFKRRVGHHVEKGSESGLGDVALLAHLQACRHDTRNTTFAWSVLGGIKFPTGFTHRIKEEIEHHEEEEGGSHTHPSGVHGHDLTLGSGSFDGIVGTSFYVRWRRAFLTAAAQYAIRTEGDHTYEYANDLIWSGGPGAYLLFEDGYTLALQANVSGENKGRDRFLDEIAVDTGITSVFVGPQLLATFGSRCTVDVGIDLPVSIDNTALQIVPDYRVRGALAVRF